jgi:hypothetical protein
MHDSIFFIVVQASHVKVGSFQPKLLLIVLPQSMSHPWHSSLSKSASSEHYFLKVPSCLLLGQGWCKAKKKLYVAHVVGRRKKKTWKNKEEKTLTYHNEWMQGFDF